MAMAAKESTTPEGRHDLRHISLEPNAVADFWWFSSRADSADNGHGPTSARPRQNRNVQL